MEYPVIKITEKHLTRVAELESLCFPCPWNIEQFQHALQDDFTELFGICTEDENVVAYLLCSVAGDYAEILNIATHPSQRRKGYAKKLLSFWLRQKHIQGIHIILEVRAKNLPAQNLYGLFGFKKIHVRKNYYPDDDALVMQLE